MKSRDAVPIKSPVMVTVTEPGLLVMAPLAGSTDDTSVAVKGRGDDTTIRTGVPAQSTTKAVTDMKRNCLEMTL